MGACLSQDSACSRLVFEGSFVEGGDDFPTGLAPCGPFGLAQAWILLQPQKGVETQKKVKKQKTRGKKIDAAPLSGSWVKQRATDTRWEKSG